MEDTDSPGPWPFDVDKKSEDQPILQNTDSTSDDSPPELEDTFNRGDHPTAYSSSTYLTDTIGKTNTPSTNAGAPALRPVEGPRCRDVQDINMDSPGKELQHKLLRHYVDWIHPQLPFLDIQAIVETITTTAAIHPHGMSSLLLYAILFAGSLYSEDQDFSSTSYGLKSCGQSRLWRKAKVGIEPELLLRHQTIRLSVHSLTDLPDTVSRVPELRLFRFSSGGSSLISPKRHGPNITRKCHCLVESEHQHSARTNHLPRSQNP